MGRPWRMRQSDDTLQQVRTPKTKSYETFQKEVYRIIYLEKTYKHFNVTDVL